MSESMEAACLENMPFGVLIFDGDKKIVYINTTLRKYLGLTANGALSGNPVAVLPSTFAAGVTGGQRIIELPGAGAGQRPRMLQCWSEPLPSAKGRLTACYTVDMSEFHHAALERDRLAEELSRLTTRDAITGLPNRQALLQALEPLVSRSRRYSNPLSIIRLCVGNIQNLDQQHGAGSADAALVALSHLLRDQTRWADLIGRFGDDEFLLVLPETTEENAHVLAEKLLARVNELLVTNDHGKTFTIIPELGVAAWKKGDDSSLLLSTAKQATKTGGPRAATSG